MSKEMVGGCCVCSDERGWPDNPLVYCDGSGCTVAVHQACYGIVTVPTGPWYCRKCESPENKGKARCALCPGRSGALKMTDTGGWAHVVCALYIPEVRFASVTSMEPIVLGLIPPERFHRKCYICEDNGKPQKASIGACMQCNKTGCRQQFHVTCAQSQGLLCEEAGNYLDNVKYCGYCSHHYSKLKRCGNVKTVPPYKPVAEESHSSDSTAEEADEEPPTAAPPADATQHHKSKGGRKRSHSSGSAKSSASGKAQPPLPPLEVCEEPDAPVTRKLKNSDKHKKKSPGRSSAGEGSGSKNSTPAPSPQHTAESTLPSKGAAGTSSAKPAGGEAPPPTTKSHATVCVINTVASVADTAPPPQTTISTVATTSTPAPATTYQESVITNAAAMDTKQTKKRKAIVAAQAAAAAAAAAAAEQAANNANNESAPPQQNWDQKEDYDATRKLKRPKAEGEVPAQYPSVSAANPLPPPPPTAHWPRTPSPRHHQSPLAGPSGMNPPAPITSTPQQHAQGEKSERDGQASLLVSVPLPSASCGINLSTHQQVSVEAGVGHPGQAMHAHPPRSWAGLNVHYEPQHAPQDKPGSSGVGGASKEAGSAPAPMPASVRNRKRAAITAASAQPLPPPASPIQMAPASQSLASMRRAPQPAPPPVPLYNTEIVPVPDSPPTSPGERAVKQPEQTSAYRAPSAHHMLGNELNPESVAADRLQEQLDAEMAAYEANAAAAAAADLLMVPPPLINKAVSASTSGAQSLDQLLERHWEQGSQFLMEQAQHFDIASLLSCLHQLRSENARLQDTVSDLLHRRNHLLAVNGRLAIPLISGVGAGAAREHGAPPPARPPRSETLTSAHQSAPDQRPHQRPAERPDERPPMRPSDGVTHIPSHAHRPITLEAQTMTMREKPS